MVNINELVPGISIIKYKHTPHLFVCYDSFKKLITIRNSKKERINLQDFEVDELYFDTNNTSWPIIVNSYRFTICNNKIHVCNEADEDTLCIINDFHCPFHLVQKQMEKDFKKPAIINDIDSLIGYTV